MMVRLLFVLLYLTAMPASADETAEANRLFVESVKLLSQADALDAETDKLPLLEQALSKLNGIIDQHPSSDLAVKLITNQSIGDISISNVRSQISSTKERIALTAARQAETEARQAEKERKDAARETAEAQKQRDYEACMATLDLGEPACKPLIAHIAYIHIRAGNIQTGIAILDRPDLTGPRNGILSDNAIALLEGGNHQEAAALIDRIENPSEYVFSVLAESQAQAGDYDGALLTLSRLAGTDRYDMTAGFISRRQALRGDYDDAKKTAQLITDTTKQAEQHHLIANHQARTGDLDSAYETVGLAPRPSPQDQTPLHKKLAAIYYAYQGDYAQAQALASALTDPKRASDTYRAITLAQAEAGHFADAAQTAANVTVEPYRDAITDQTILVLIESGHLDAAADTIQKLDDPDSFLSALAPAYATRGGVAAALATAQQIEAPVTRDYTLHDLVIIHAQTGNLTAAEAALEAIQNPEENAYTTGIRPFDGTPDRGLQRSPKPHVFRANSPSQDL